MPSLSEINGKMTPGMNPWEPFTNFVKGLNSEGITQVPVNVQTDMAIEVSKVRDRMFADYKANGGTMDIDTYFEPGRGPGAKALRDAPIDVSIYANQKINLPYNGRRTSFALGDLVPQLRDIHTVGGATRFVANSLIPAINERLRFTEDMPEKTNQMYAAVAQSVWTFTPNYQSGGKTHSRSLVNHASYAAISSLTALRRSEKTIIDPSYNEEMGGGNVAGSDPFTEPPVAPRNINGYLDDVFGRVQGNSRVIYGDYGVTEQVRRFITPDGQVQSVGAGGALSTMGVRPGDYAPGLVGVLQPHRTDDLGNPVYDYPGGGGTMHDVADQLESGAPVTMDIMRRMPDGSYRPMTVAGHGTYNPRPETSHIVGKSGPLISYVSGIQNRYRGSNDPVLNSMLAHKMTLAERMTVKDPTIVTNTVPAPDAVAWEQNRLKQIGVLNKRLVSLEGRRTFLQTALTDPKNDTDNITKQIVSLNDRIGGARRELATLTRSYTPTNERTAEDYWGSEDRLATEKQSAVEPSGVNSGAPRQTVVDAQDYKYVPARSTDPFPTPGVDEYDPSTIQMRTVAKTGHTSRVTDILTDEQADINNQIFRNVGNRNGDARSGTVTYEERLVQSRLSRIQNPATRAAIEWVGSAKKEAVGEWAASVRQLNEQLNTNLPTDPEQFGEAFRQLELDDPITADQFRGIIPTRAELAKKFSKARQGDRVSNAAVEAIASEPTLTPSVIGASASPVNTRPSGARRSAEPSYQRMDAIREENAAEASSLVTRARARAEANVAKRSQHAVNSRHEPVSQLLLPERAISHTARNAPVNVLPSGDVMEMPPKAGTASVQEMIDFDAGNQNYGFQMLDGTSYTVDTGKKSTLERPVVRDDNRARSSGSGTPPPPEPPDAAQVFADDEDDGLSRFDYENKILHTTDKDGKDVRAPRHNPQRRPASNYDVDINNPINSLVEFKQGYTRWERQRVANHITTNNSREDYENYVRSAYEKASRAPKREQAKHIRDQFSFLEPKHQRQLINALRKEFDPELEAIPDYDTAYGDIEPDPAVAREETFATRARAANRANFYSQRPSHSEYAARIRAEKRLSAAFNDGELPLFLHDQEFSNLRKAARAPARTLRTNYGSISMDALNDPKLEQSLPRGVTTDHLARGQRWAEEALDSATTGPMLTDARGAVGTVSKRAQTAINNMVNKYVDELVGEGMDRPTAEQKAKVVKAIADGVVKATENLHASMSDDYADGLAASKMAVREASDVRTAAGLEAVLKNPTISEQIARANLTPEDILNLQKDKALLVHGTAKDGTPVSYNLYGRDEKGRSYSMERGEYGTPGGMSDRLWNSKAGRFLYGAYISKRMWGMAAGPTLQQADAYGKYMSSIGYLASYGVEDPSMLSTEAGYSSRQFLGEQWLGRGSQQQFGTFQDIPFYLSQSGNDAVARQFASAKMAFSVGAIGMIAPGMLAQFAPLSMQASMGAMTSALGTAGLYAAGGLLASSLAVEAKNSYAHKNNLISEYDDITLGSEFKRIAVIDPAISRAGSNFGNALYQKALSSGQSLYEAAQSMGAPSSIADTFIGTGNVAVALSSSTPRSRYDVFTGGLNRPVFSEVGAAHLSGATSVRNIYEGLVKGSVTSASSSAFSSLDPYSMSQNERDFVAQYMSDQDVMFTGMGVSEEERENLARIRSLTEEAIKAGAGDDAGAGINAMFKMLGSSISNEQVRKTVSAGLTSGRQFPAFVTEAASHASNYGYLPGTDEFAKLFFEYAGVDTEEARQRLSYSDARVASLGSQIQAQFGYGSEYAGLGARIVQQAQLNTPAKITGASTLLAAAQSGGAVLSPMQANFMSQISSQMGPLQSQVFASTIGSAAAFMGATGQEQLSLTASFSGLGLTNQQAQNFAQVFSGDLSARSYMGWESGYVGDIFHDRFNNPIWETNGNMFLNNVSANLGQLPAMRSAYGNKFVGGSNLQTAANILGISSDSSLVSAFLRGGEREMMNTHSQRSYELSMASAGVQMAGIRLQEQFYWGSGSWDAPSADSMWGLQDVQRQMSYTSTMADFSSQWERMQLQERYAIQQEKLQKQRMAASNRYNNWSQTFSYNQSLLQRDWAQEDWAYQDQMRSLNFGWQMEDMDLNIRYSSGRERRQLVKQKERAVLTQNLEEEQIDETRDRQKKTWALEDERFRKTRDYTLELQKLDKEGFRLQKEHRIEMTELEKQDYSRKVREFKESYDLETKMIALQREFQKEQLELQKASAGIAAEAAKNQREYEIATKNLGYFTKDYVGEIGKLSQYKQAFLVTAAMTTLAKTIDTTDPYKVNALKQLFQTMSNISHAGLLNAILELGD